MKSRRRVAMAIGGISFSLVMNACASHPAIRTDTEQKGYAVRGEIADPSQIFALEIPLDSESSKGVERTVGVRGAPSGKSPELLPRQKSGEVPLPAPKREEPKIAHESIVAAPPLYIALVSPEAAKPAIPQQKPKVPTKKSVTVTAASKKDCPCEITVTTPLPTVIDKTTIVSQSRDPIILWLFVLLAMGSFGILVVLSLILREMQSQNNPANNPRRPTARV